jgi:hypothetical protein
MKPILTISVAGLLLAATVPSFAGTTVFIASEPAAPNSEGWRFNLAPYVWLTAMTGGMRIGATTAPVDVSIKDTLENVDMAFMIAGAARSGLTTAFISPTWGISAASASIRT